MALKCSQKCIHVYYKRISAAPPLATGQPAKAAAGRRRAGTNGSGRARRGDRGVISPPGNDEPTVSVRRRIRTRKLQYERSITPARSRSDVVAPTCVSVGVSLRKATEQARATA